MDAAIFQPPRRVFTAPTYLPSSQHTRPSASSSSSLSQGSVETLYSHPNVKIVAFTSSARSIPRSSLGGLSGPPQEVAAGKLSWSSQLERTIAFGAFRIYRAPGSVAFLNCGSALQPILPKSQCWCIQEDASKFVLQIRKPQYWRIELPIDTPDDRELAESLKVIFDQVLMFEKIECPFERTFTVTLPEPPETPIRKRPWVPARTRVTLPECVLSPETPSPPKIMGLGPATPPRPPRFSDANPIVKEETVYAPTTTPSSDEQQAVSSLVVSPVTQSPVMIAPFSPPAPACDVTGLSGLSPPDPVQDTLDSSLLGVRPVVDVIEEKIASSLNQNNEQTNLASLRPDDMTGVQSESSICNESRKTTSPHAPRSILPTELPTTPTPTPGQLSDGSPVPSLIRANTPESHSLDTEPTSPPLSHVRPVEPVFVPSSPFTSNERANEPPSPSVISTPHRPSRVVLDAIPEANKDIEGSCGELHEGKAVGSGASFSKRILGRPGFRSGRATMAPPQLTLIMSPPSKSRHQAPGTLTVLPKSRLSAQSGDDLADASHEESGHVSPTESHDSFHSAGTGPTPQTPDEMDVSSAPLSRPLTTFPFPHDTIYLPKASQGQVISDATVTPVTSRTWDLSSLHSESSSGESAATAPDHIPACSSVTETPAPAEQTCTSTAVNKPTGVRHRPTTSISVRRALSPLPSPANLFSSPPVPAAKSVTARRPKLDIVRRIPLAIISKTCELILGPPNYLVTLMLKVAAKIVAGEWRGNETGVGEDGQKMNVAWDYSDDEFSDWDDDECFVPATTGMSDLLDSDEEDRSAKNEDSTDASGRSWGID